MKLLRRQRPFLDNILKEANQSRRRQILEHANADQISAVSEMVLSLLKNRIPIDASTYGKLKRHRKVLREIGKCRNSVKRRREHLLKQKGGGFWTGFGECFRVCCAPWTWKAFVPTHDHVARSEPTRRRNEGTFGSLEKNVPQFVSRTYGLYFERLVCGLSNET